MKPTRASPATYALIEAARSEFIEQGYGGAKTREIARRAGTSEVTLFRHFGSKANLFRETVFQPVNDYLNEFIASELPADGPMEMSPENLRKFTSRLFEVITGTPAANASRTGNPNPSASEGKTSPVADFRIGTKSASGTCCNHRTAPEDVSPPISSITSSHFQPALPMMSKGAFDLVAGSRARCAKMVPPTFFRG